MNLEVIKNVGSAKLAISKTLGRTGLILQKHSPEILTSVGIVGVVASAVLASKATLKLEPIVDRAQNNIQEAEELTHEKSADEYSSTDHKKAVTKIYVHTAADVAKLYAPSVTLGAVSIACLVGAHGIMRKRNVALAAAYKTIEQGYSAYRARVIEEFGEEKDEEYRRGFRTEEIRDEKGKVTSVVTHVDPNGHSPYARFFDEYNKHWQKAPEYNLLFLKCQQEYHTNMLRARGHVFLNEVYDDLGFDRTKEGSVVGWILNEEGDNFVDFNIYDFQSEAARNFVNGNEASILLDFNVDGVIFDKI